MNLEGYELCCVSNLIGLFEGVSEEVEDADRFHAMLRGIPYEKFIEEQAFLNRNPDAVVYMEGSTIPLPPRGRMQVNRHWLLCDAVPECNVEISYESTRLSSPIKKEIPNNREQSK